MVRAWVIAAACHRFVAPRTSPAPSSTTAPTIHTQIGSRRRTVRPAPPRFGSPSPVAVARVGQLERQLAGDRVAVGRDDSVGDPVVAGRPELAERRGDHVARDLDRPGLPVVLSGPVTVTVLRPSPFCTGWSKVSSTLAGPASTVALSAGLLADERVVRERGRGQAEQCQAGQPDDTASFLTTCRRSCRRPPPGGLAWSRRHRNRGRARRPPGRRRRASGRCCRVDCGGRGSPRRARRRQRTRSAAGRRVVASPSPAGPSVDDRRRVLRLLAALGRRRRVPGHDLVVVVGLDGRHDELRRPPAAGRRRPRTRRTRRG